MDDYKRHLLQIIQEGLVKDIFKAEQALSLLKTIGEFSKKINTNNFGEVFGTLQNFCIEQFVLCVTKIYEKPHARYPLMNIPSVLDYLKDNAEKLSIVEP